VSGTCANMSRRRLVAVVFAVCVAVLDGAVGAQETPGAVDVSALPAWARVMEGVNTPDSSLADLAGEVTILHFWASWCAPCRDELPALQAFQDAQGAALAQEGVRIVTISNDFRADDAQRMLEKSGLSLPVLLDSRQTINLALAGQRTLPLTLAILPDGSIHILARGPMNWSSPDMLESLRASVAGRKF